MSNPKPLWKAEDQRARLAELTARSDDPVKDNALRRDVRSLGILLGQILVEQAGQELFDEVEHLRKLLIEHRKQAGRRRADAKLMRQAQGLISKQEADWHQSGAEPLAKKGPPPFSFAEVETGLTGGITTRRMATLVSTYGVNFTLTANTSKRLADDGADATLLAAISTSRH